MQFNASALLVFLGSIAAFIIGCSAPTPTRARLTQTPTAPSYACVDRAWHFDWSDEDSCTTCVESVARCVQSKGLDFCRAECDACLGEDVCQVPSNIEWAQTSLKASRAQPGRVHAFIRADLNQVPTSWIDYNDAGYIRVPTDNSVRLIGPQGDSWTLPPAEAECQQGQLAQTIVHRNCPDRIERYDLPTGFRFPDIALPTPVDLKTARIEVDPVGATYLISRADQAQIFRADGTLVVSHDNPSATLRVGATWVDHVVTISGMKIRDAALATPQHS